MSENLNTIIADQYVAELNRLSEEYAVAANMTEEQKSAAKNSILKSGMKEYVFGKSNFSGLKGAPNTDSETNLHREGRFLSLHSQAVIVNAACMLIFAFSWCLVASNKVSIKGKCPAGEIDLFFEKGQPEIIS